jgi:hypothetical protein
MARDAQRGRGRVRQRVLWQAQPAHGTPVSRGGPVSGATAALFQACAAQGPSHSLEGQEDGGDFTHFPSSPHLTPVWQADATVAYRQSGLGDSTFPIVNASTVLACTDSWQQHVNLVNGLAAATPGPTAAMLLQVWP